MRHVNQATFLLLLLVVPCVAQDKVTYDDHVRPILQRRCGKCHDAEKKRADLDVMSYQSMLAGASTGEVLQPGQPADSRLYLLVSHQEEPYMPPSQPRMPAAELKIIRQWIEGGLLENAGSKAKKSKKAGVDLALSAPVTGKPDGPPPMPGSVLLDPVVITARAGTVAAMAHSPWAPLLAIGGQQQVILYNTSSLEMCGVLPFPEGDPKSLRFSRNGRFLLVGGGKDSSLGVAALFDITTGRRVTRVGRDEDAVLTADITSDQTLIVTGGPDRLVKVFSIATGEESYRIKKHTDWVTAVGFSPDSVLMATGDRGGNLRVWEARDGARFYDLRGHRGAIRAVRFRPDSNVLASASLDGTVKLWDMHTGRQVRSFNAHRAGAEDVNFASDGRLVTAGRDGQVKTWDANGRAQRQFEAFGEAALAAVFDHEGKRVVGADWAGQVRAWNVEDGKHLGDLAANPPSLDARIRGLTRQLSGPDLPGRVSKLREAMAVSAKTATDELATVRARKQALEATVKSQSELIAKLSKEIDTSRVAVKDATGRLPGVREEISRLETDLNAHQKECATADAATKAAQEMIDARVSLVTAQEQATAAAAALAEEAGSDPDLARAAQLAGETLEALKRTVGTAQGTHGKAVATQDACRKKATDTEVILKARRADVATFLRALEDGKKIETNSVPARDRARAERKEAALEAKALAVPLVALERVAATFQKQADDAAELSDAVATLGTRLRRLRAAQVFTGLFHAREELDAAAQLVNRRTEALMEVRAARLESERALMKSQEERDAALAIAASAEQAFLDADSDRMRATTALAEADRSVVHAAAEEKAASTTLEAAIKTRDADSERLSGVDGEVVASRDVLDATRTKVADHQVGLDASRKALAAHDEVAARSQEVIRKLDLETQELRSQLGKLDRDDEAARSAISEHAAAMAAARATVAALEQRRPGVEKKVAEAETVRGTALAARTGGEQVLAERKDDHARLESSLHALRQQVDDWSASRLRVRASFREKVASLTEIRNAPEAKALMQDAGVLASRFIGETVKQIQGARSVRRYTVDLSKLSRAVEQAVTMRDDASSAATRAESSHSDLLVSLQRLTSDRDAALAEVKRLEAVPVPADTKRKDRDRLREDLRGRVAAADEQGEAPKAEMARLTALREPLAKAASAEATALESIQGVLVTQEAALKQAVEEAARIRKGQEASVAAVAAAERRLETCRGNSKVAGEKAAAAREGLAPAVTASEQARAARDAARPIADDREADAKELLEVASRAREVVRSAEELVDGAEAERRQLAARVGELEAAYERSRQ